MECPRCGKFADEGFYCRWCGAELDIETDIDPLSAMTSKFQYWRISSGVEAAKILYRVDCDKLYLEKYDTVSEYGRWDLDISSPLVSQYLRVCKYYMEDGKRFIILRGEEWGIGKLSEFLPLPATTVNEIIARGEVKPSMTLKDIREALKPYKVEKRSNPYYK